tara:strand:+ start:159 stop:809 length:651 start_codon:yes stop_codon:yes gene_type:complete
VAIKVKICGVDRQETVEASVDAGASMIGLVFYEKSPRFLNLTRATSITQNIPKSVKKVGLFVDPTNREISEVIENVKIDTLQLHGNESPERVRDIKDFTGLSIIKVIKVRTLQDLNLFKAFVDIADNFLFDAKVNIEKNSNLPGGNAISFDWKVLSGVKIPKPWILAGGLDKNNVSEAIKITNAKAVDVSTGVEDKLGVKGTRKIIDFIEATRKLS